MSSPNRVPVWRFELFGGLRAYRYETGANERSALIPAKLPPLRRACTLLDLLLIFESGSRELVSREELGEHLWPGDPPDSIRDRFKQTLAVLRRFLEPASEGVAAGSVLIADRLHTGLIPGSFTSDIDEFRRALRISGKDHSPEQIRDSLERGLGLYRGELLPGDYEDLILAERARLAEWRLEALLELARRNAVMDRLQEAIANAREAVAADPIREESHRLLMELLVKAGRHAEAVRQFRSLETLLEQETGAPPSPETFALIDPVRIPAAPVARPEPRQIPEPVERPVSPPLPPNRFIGREAELADIEVLLTGSGSEPASQIVTLVGTGGAGKTRLALESASRFKGSFDSIIFVPLAAVQDAERIPAAIRASAGISAGDGDLSNSGSPLPKIAVELERQGRVLLILDNLEQFGTAASESVFQLLQGRTGTGSLSILATSRFRLELGAERVIAVEPLATPGIPGTPERLSEFASVRLFVDRATAISPGFRLTPQNSSDVAALCRRLDGLPLALELAAAWIPALSPAQLLARINHRSSMLSSNRADLPDRHRSLHAVIDSSVRLLPHDLQRLFARLSVFQGGWTLEAAEDICAANGDERFEILPQLASLQRHSLIIAATIERPGSTSVRWRMLEAPRDYASDTLTGDERRDICARHADFFYRYIPEKTRALLAGEAPASVFGEMDTEIDNIRSAHRFLVQSGNVHDSLLMAARIWRYAEHRGSLSDGIAMIEAALDLSRRVGRDLTQEESGSKAGALNSLAVLLSNRGEHGRLAELWQESAELFRSAGRVADAMNPLANIAMLAVENGEYARGVERFEEILAFQRSSGDRVAISVTLTNLGSALTSNGEFERAFAAFEESLLLKRAHSHPLSIAISLSGLSRCAYHTGRLDLAKAYGDEALEIYLEAGDKSLVVECLTGLACVAREERDYKVAARHFASKLMYLWEMERSRYILTTMECLAEIALRLGDPGTGIRLWSWAAGERLRGNVEREPSTRLIFDAIAVEEELRTALAPDDFAREWTAGLLLTGDAAYRLAISVTDSGLLIDNFRKISG